MDVPEYGGRPKTHLERHGHDLANIPDKNIQRRQGPAKPHAEDAHAEDIVNELKIVKAEGEPVKSNQPHKKEEEYRMGYKAGDNLDDRQNL